MVKDGRYEVVKDITLNTGKNLFKKGSIIYRTNGVYYLDGGLLSPWYQDYLKDFMKEEEEIGWEYVCPLKSTKAFKNGKEDID